MQQQAELIGLKTMTGRAIRFQVQCVIFALVFRLTASAVEVLVEHLGAGLRPIRHDKACIDALLADLNLDLPIRSIDFYYPEFQAATVRISRDKSKMCFLKTTWSNLCRNCLNLL